MATAATSITVTNQLIAAIKNGDTRSWAGQFANQPLDVEAAKVGLISHSGKPVSSAGVAYRVKSADGSEWNWIFAWSFEVGNPVKIYNAIQSSGQIDWDNVRQHLRVATDLQATAAGLKANLHAEAKPGTGAAELTATISYNG